MNTYKITNITHLLGRRDFKANSVLDIEYVNGLTKQIIKLKPNESVYLTINSLPISVHKLRVNELVTVIEIGKEELNETINILNKKLQPQKINIEQKENVENKKNITKKTPQSMRVRNKK